MIKTKVFAALFIALTITTSFSITSYAAMQYTGYVTGNSTSGYGFQFIDRGTTKYYDAFGLETELSKLSGNEALDLTVEGTIDDINDTITITKVIDVVTPYVSAKNNFNYTNAELIGVTIGTTNYKYKFKLSNNNIVDVVSKVKLSMYDESSNLYNIAGTYVTNTYVDGRPSVNLNYELVTASNLDPISYTKINETITGKFMKNDRGYYISGNNIFTLYSLDLDDVKYSKYLNRNVTITLVENGVLHTKTNSFNQLGTTEISKIIINYTKSTKSVSITSTLKKVNGLYYVGSYKLEGYAASQSANSILGKTVTVTGSVIYNFDGLEYSVSSYGIKNAAIYSDKTYASTALLKAAGGGKYSVNGLILESSSIISKYNDLLVTVSGVRRLKCSGSALIFADSIVHNANVTRTYSTEEKLATFFNYVPNANSTTTVAINLHYGITHNNCVYYASTALRAIGVKIPTSIANTTQLYTQLKYLAWVKHTDYKKLIPGSVCFTTGVKGSSGPSTHVYTFAGWVTPGKYDYAYVWDNQQDNDTLGSLHIRNISKYDVKTDREGIAFFMTSPLGQLQISY